MTVPTPSPPPVAEPGYTTTEFIALLGNVAQAVIVCLVAFGVHISNDQRMAIMGLESTLVTTGVVGYALARGIRKAGTSG